MKIKHQYSGLKSIAEQFIQYLSLSLSLFISLSISLSLNPLLYFSLFLSISLNPLLSRSLSLPFSLYLSHAHTHTHTLEGYNLVHSFTMTSLDLFQLPFSLYYCSQKHSDPSRDVMSTFLSLPIFFYPSHILLGQTVSSCPGEIQCSGHGVCSQSTYRCSCDIGWESGDCSEMACPVGPSW